MSEKPPPTLDFPLRPLGSAGGTCLFALAADQLAEAIQAETSFEPRHEALARHFDLEPPDGQSQLHELLRKARGAPVQLGRYNVLRVVGSGGMGVVYEAVNRESNLRVALKTLRHLNGASLYRFKNEFRSAQSVVHPNLCALYELVSHEDEWFFTMEYIEGTSFTEHVRGAAPAAPAAPVAPRSAAEAPLGFDEALLRAALQQLAEGVAALHEAGKLHRDLNASNVLVTRAGRVVILDFGLIIRDPRAGGEAGSFDVLSGTPGHMAPEQGEGVPASTASDWYAVGVMLYVALTGRLPFTGSISRVLSDKRTTDPAPPRALCPAVPEDLDALCVALLRRAPEERPSGKDVLRELGGAPVVDLGARSFDALPGARAAFIGRDQELRALADALADVSLGRPVGVHVRGPSGMGKSALVHRFLSGLREDGRALVLEGRCYERESVPYKAFDCLLDALTRYLRSLPGDEVVALLPQDIHALARLFPVLGGVSAVDRIPPRRFEVRDPQEVRRRALDGLKELLRRIAAMGPLVLYIDDLQWGDLDSARLIVELLSPPDPPGLLLITTHQSDAARESLWLLSLRTARSPEPWPRAAAAFESAAAAGLVREVSVEALCREHAIELALCRMQRRDPEARAIAEVIADESDGSPFLVEELARDAERVHRSPDGGAQVSLEQLVQARLDRLGPDARRLLELIAVAGRPIEQGLLLAASDIEHRAPAALVKLRSSRLIRAQGFRDADCVEIYHDRMRKAVMVRLSPEVLRDHHRRLALTLEARDGASAQRGNPLDPERLSLHFFAAGMLEQAAMYAEVAASRAEAALAFERAADLYRAALDRRPRDPASARPLRLKCARALVNAGRGAEAAPLYLDCAVGAPADESLDLQRRAAEQLLLTGHIAPGLRALRPVLAAHGLSYSYTPLGASLSLTTRLARLRVRGTRFRAQSERRIDPQIRARINACWSAGRGLSSVDAMGAVYLVEALLLALDAGDVDHSVAGLAVVGSMYLFQGGRRALSRGRELTDEAARLAARSEDPYLLGLTENTSGFAHLCKGAWRKAFTHIERGNKLLRDRCVGTTWERKMGRAAALFALFAIGELKKRSRYAHAWLREANAIGDLDAAVGAALYVALDRLVDGDPGGARAEARAAIGRWLPEGLFSHHLAALAIETWCDLHEDRPRDAFTRVRDAFPALERSNLLQVQLSRIEMLMLRAQSALGLALAVRAPRERRRLLRIAGADAARLAGEGRPHASAAAAVIQAGIAWNKGRPDLAAAKLHAAKALYDAAEMKLHAACARRRLAALAGDHGGIAAADAVFQEEGIVEPARWARMYTGWGF